MTEFGYPYAPDDGRENPDAPPSAARVVRGGSWNDGQHNARAAYRRWNHSDARSYHLGFRLVMSAPIAPVLLAAGAA